MKSPAAPNFGRRILVAGFAAALVTHVSTALAAQPLVEIIAFSHPPVQVALRPLRTWLQARGNKVRVVEMDMEGPEAQRRLKAVGMTGHLPIVILVDGQYRYTRPDGVTVQFISFPAESGSPAAAKGTWSLDDVVAPVQP